MHRVVVKRINGDLAQAEEKTFKGIPVFHRTSAIICLNRQLHLLADSTRNLYANACSVRMSHPRIRPVLFFFTFFRMTYVVASKIKELINAKGMMSAGDLADAASKALEGMLTKAVQRAAANGRKTVRPEDL